MKKILYVHHAGTVGGAPWSLLYTIKALDSSLYSAHVLFLHPGKLEDLFSKEQVSHSVIQHKQNFAGHQKLVHIEPAYAKWYQFGKIFQMFKWWYQVSNNYATKELSLLDFDIVHLNSITLIDWAKAAKIAGKKVVLHVREPLAKGLFGIRRTFIRKQIDQYCDHVIAISKDNAKRVGLPSKTTVVYNFSDFSKFDTKIRPLFNKQEGVFYVLYMGGAKKFKGFEILAKSIRSINGNVTLVLAGDYSRFKKRGTLVSFKRILNRLIYRVPDFDNLLKDSRIKLIGLSTDVPELIQSCDAVLFPALKTHFPRPLIEGMAMKKMSLAFDIDGIEEVIKDQQNGLIIRDKTSRGLANGINELASMTKDRHNQMSEFGYQFARTNFSNKNIKQITSIYDQL